MRLQPIAFLLVLGVAGTALPRAQAGFDLFRNLWGDVLVTTDTTPAGHQLTPPTRAQPVYYQGISLGRRLGSVPGDREPSEHQLNRFAADLLAKQGYLDARTAGKEPTLLLVLQWGYLNPAIDDLTWFLGYNPDQDIAAREQINFIGAEVFRLSFRSAVIERIVEDAQNPIYAIMITAFEYKSSRTKEPIAYWQTRIGLPTHGKSMADALPVMLVAAAPAIGRPSDTPVLTDADAARKGSVNLGDLKFLEPMPSLHRAPEAGEEKKE